MITALFLSFVCLMTGHTTDRGLTTSSEIGADSLTVYVFLLDECLISQFYTPELTRLNETYEKSGVGFIGYFPNSNSSNEDIDMFAEEYHLEFPLKTDHKKVFVEKFDISVTPEVAVWDHRSDRLLYRGRIDDSYVRVGKRKTHTKSHDLEEVIQNWIAKESGEQLIETQAIGCFINFDNNRQ